MHHTCYVNICLAFRLNENSSIFIVAEAAVCILMENTHRKRNRDQICNRKTKNKFVFCFSFLLPSNTNSFFSPSRQSHEYTKFSYTSAMSVHTNKKREEDKLSGQSIYFKTRITTTTTTTCEPKNCPEIIYFIYLLRNNLKFVAFMDDLPSIAHIFQVCQSQL